MCDTYITNIGYLCDDCKSEFKEQFPNDIKKSRKFFYVKLHEFMNSPKFCEDAHEEITIDEFL